MQDVNLFLNDPDSSVTGEIEVMIAERNMYDHNFCSSEWFHRQRKGCGRESLLLMMWFASSKLNVEKFIAKIGMGNRGSLHLFEHSLTFREISRSPVFEEVTLESPPLDFIQTHYFPDIEGARIETYSKLPA